MSDATGYTIFSLPTLANPDCIDDVNELRRELHRANQELMWRTAAFAEFQAKFRDVYDSASALAFLARAYRDGRRDYVNRMLLKLAAAMDEDQTAAPGETARMH
jgi:hypothetical protein